mgnify:CR=1 FL=1
MKEPEHLFGGPAFASLGHACRSCWCNHASLVTALHCQGVPVQDIHPQYVVDENADRKAVMHSTDDW